MALPNFNINPYIQPYIGGAQKEIGELMNQRVADYDLASEGYDVLGYQNDTLEQNISPFDSDKLYARELTNKYRTEIDKASERGDYEFMLRDIKRSARQFAAETTPLIARRKAFDDYKKTVQDQYQKGDIGLNMYNAALNKTINDNSNVDKETVMSGSFSGFVPTKKVDISKMLDDAIKGMEANGMVGKMQINKDGTYTIVGGEFRNANDILKAASSYLEGSSDYKNYRNTMYQLGLDKDLESEKLFALNAVAEKYKFNKPDVQQGFVPQDAWDRYASQFEPDSPLPIAPGEVTENPQTKNEYETSIIAPDGNLIRNTNYYKANSDGSYTKYTDKQGKNLTLNEVEELRNSVGYSEFLSGIQGKEARKVEDPTNSYKVSKEEAEKLRVKQGAKFNNLVENTLLSEQGFDLRNLNNVQRKVVTNTETFQNKVKDKNYRKQVLDKYNEALKNHQKVETVMWTKRNPVSFKAVGNLNKNENSGALETLLSSNRKISIISLDAKDVGLQTGFQDGKTDINTVYKKLEDKGWQVESIEDMGLLTANPLDPDASGSSNVKLTITKKDGDTKKTRYITAALGLDTKDRTPMLRKIQEVSNAHYSGNGGTISLPDGTYWQVITVPNYLTKGQTVPFTSKVVRLDKDGNTISERIPYDEFIELDASEIVKQEAERFLVNKK